MKIKEKLTEKVSSVKNLATAALLAATIALSPTPATAGGSVELMAGHQSTTLDTKVSTEVAEKTGLFIRQMTTSTPEGEVSYFGLADLSYKLVGGLDVVGEIQAAPGMGVIPRAGLQHFGKVGDLAVYALATVKTMEHPDGEIVVSLSYTPKLGESIDLLMSLEDLTSIGKEGHQFSAQKLRAGITLMEKYHIGAAANLTELGPDGSFGYDIGGFVGVDL